MFDSETNYDLATQTSLSLYLLYIYSYTLQLVYQLQLLFFRSYSGYGIAAAMKHIGIFSYVCP